MPPPFLIISDILNEPPISTIWPLEQITSAFSDKELIINKRAAALLFTTTEFSVPQIEAMCLSMCD